MLSVAVMLLSLSVMRGFKSIIREKIRGFSGDIIVLKYDLNASLESSPFTIGADTLKKIMARPNLEFYQSYAIKPGIINTNNEIEGVMLKGVDSAYHWDYFKSILVEGNVIDFSDRSASGRQILISRYLANRLRLKVGDDFLMYFVQDPLRKRKFEIRGIFDLGVEEVDKNYVVGDISVIRRLNDWNDNQIGGLELRVKDFSQLDRTASQVYYELPAQKKSWSVKEYYPEIFDWLSLLDVNTQVILVLMLAVAVINMISALLIMILERTNMIGILKALGMGNWGIQRIFLLNASWLIGLGMLLGNVLGLSFAAFQNYTHFFKLDQASYYMAFVPVELNINDILLVNAGTLLICVLILVIPSAIVTKIAPVKAINFQ